MFVESQEILICSPDTDIYHIWTAVSPHKISAIHTQELQLLYLNHLIRTCNVHLQERSSDQAQVAGLRVCANHRQ